ncbi:uncharacterized protein G2W53_033464 [Senna tora]|uniref:Helitron helicase-like domain-containing protein n=1 Tax=Senna tora TaxID=362788 RepID=A0A834SZ75_9FABA|nr:uncharacterized protein G2W53_033464 [Senna tora]
MSLRAHNYNPLAEALFRGDSTSSSISKRIVLPSSFVCGERYSREDFQDAMTICTATKFPDLFITFTCNSKWPELCRLFDPSKCTSKDSTASQIDIVISAEIHNPETHPQLYEVVKAFMIHGSCGSARKSSHCMLGYAKYCRRDSRIKVVKNGIDLCNCFDVPYNPTLLLRYQAHINVEFSNQSCSIKYLFKNVCKGHDKMVAALCNARSSSDN